ncbi:hypothetical protein Gotri_003704 [Gossypium trilobum]|uniref:Uncharacterized protein n=1 Tax=Gossypium trilobum TaxID=34281 RepID=A0A7J9F3E7_9ROSI|nr:hypothetical protein [Gossypium trilobum]
MEKELANLNLIDVEEDAFHEEATVVDQNYQFNLVRRCLTDSVVHFPSLRNTMADLWHPIWGICISNLGEKRLLDMERDTKGLISGEERDIGRNNRGDMEKSYLNPNFIPLGS